jgi:FtsP/CotA-like multicopper oxidase with cupredoxin domain
VKRAAVLMLVLAAVASPLAAQNANPPNTINCASLAGKELQPLPEIASDGKGILRGTLYTVSEMAQMPTPTATFSSPLCVPQWVRAYRKSPPENWNPSAQDLQNPLPGPTLRARVGDLIQLSFFNVIDANKFPGVDDGKCDETNMGKTYPGQPPFDRYPDCFAGSVYTNVHYHGTHTNPNTTADNVFLQIKPSPRRNNARREPLVDEKTVRSAFNDFFDKCRAQLLNDPGPKEWPRLWRDLPASTQKALLDPVRRDMPKWYEIDQEMIRQGNWPQYFVGAYPYCFKLPRYTETPQTATTSAHVHTPQTRGKGTAEVDEAQNPTRPLLMGQAPGTHWYHAHKHGSTTINVSNGMTGAFIIEGPYDDEINKAYGDGFTRKLPPIVIQQLGGVPGLSVGAFQGPGPNFAVNGQIQPTIRMQGKSVAMWRIVNSSGRAGILFLEPTALQWKQLAQDGVQFNDANYQANEDQEFLLMSGNRADLLVKAPAHNANGNNVYPVLVYNTVDPSDRPPARPYFPAATLMNVEVTPDIVPEMQFLKHAPAFPSFLSDIKDEQVTGTKVLTFASKPGTPSVKQHTIDGKQFDGEVGAVVLLNRAEEWKVVNETFPPSSGNQISHPFHIHINPFQITEVFDPNDVLRTRNGNGTVTVAAQTNGPTIVTGSAETNFKRDFRVGDWIWINGKASAGPPAAPPGIVQSIEDEHHMTIDTNKSVLAASPYQIAVPLYTIDPNTARPGQCVIDPENPKPCTNTVPAENRIWWDVFAIPSGNNFYDSATKAWVPVPGHFKMRSRFVDYAGYYVLHCHILAHEDRGMMTIVEVAPLRSPYSHH